MAEKETKICHMIAIKLGLYTIPAVGTPILGHGREVQQWWPLFWVFNPIGSLFYTPTQSDWPPLSAEKIGLSPSHLVPEILRPKVGLIFHQNVLVNSLKHFV